MSVAKNESPKQRKRRLEKRSIASKRRHKENPEKVRARTREWKKKNKDKVNKWDRENRRKAYDYELRSQYGITLEQARELFRLQGKVCKICKTEDATWCVDHIKDTKIVRGILCRNCNAGIGLLKHDTEVLQAAIYYLEPFNVQNTL